ncbi:allantoinase [Deinococcus detaillensis]|uniref:Allantoinase n=1 Tax=Deinococcus detaillensis TaxID=2592048 RepID=A0A553V4V9_9DEIO|nr:allantoinase [Deinococcus detaillensis]TSA87507.1 allantoinase [Deinococcus detaillensis]
MSFELIIRGGTLVTPDGPRQADFAVSGGQIVEIAEEISSDSAQSLNASGLHIFPGLLDAHVHLNEPGRTHWEGFETGTRALAAGGATSFFDMPLNSSPPVLDKATFDAKREHGEQNSLIDFGLWGGLTPQNLERMDELADCGVIGFKAFMSHSGLDEFPAVDDTALYEGLKTAARLNLVLATHAESDNLTRHFTEQARLGGGHTARDYLGTRPVVAELEAVQRALLYAGELGAKLHLVHLSSGAAVAMAYEAKQRGVDVSIETCPHYLHFTDEDVEKMGALLKCAPPLRSQEVQRNLWEELLAGHIDIVGSDHSPAPPDRKTSENFFALWGGISGAQSTLNVLLTDGHFKRGLPLEAVAALSALNPAHRFGIAQKGALEVGLDADFSLIDLSREFELTELYDRWKQNPYLGAKFKGLVQATYSRGRKVYEQGRFDNSVRGKLLRPTSKN